MLAPGDTLTALTAPDGPLVVRDAEQLAQAERSALRLADAHAPAHDALLLAISLDGGVIALRRQHPQLPIVGMTEAALSVARSITGRIGLLTLGAVLLPLYRQRVEQAGFGADVIAFEAPELPAAFAADAPRVSPGGLQSAGARVWPTARCGRRGGGARRRRALRLRRSVDRRVRGSRAGRRDVRRAALSCAVRQPATLTRPVPGMNTRRRSLAPVVRTFRHDERTSADAMRTALTTGCAWPEQPPRPTTARTTIGTQTRR